MFPSFLTTILFSLSVVFANRTVKLMGSMSANFYRLLIATFILACWAVAFGKAFEPKSLPYFIWSGVIGFGIADLFLFLALDKLGSRLTILLVQCLAAPFAATVEWFWLKTTLTSAQMICGLIILLGVAVAIAPKDHIHLSKKEILIGVFFGILAACGQGLGAVLSRKAYEVANLFGETINGGTAAYERILGGLPIAFIAFVVVGMRQKFDIPVIKKDWRKIWPWILLNSLAGPTLGVGCYQWALSTTPSGIVLPIVATVPLAVIPFARIIEGDRASRRSVFGGMIAVIAAIALAMVS